MKNRAYIAIDLKSFYASVECVERRLDPLSTNLVVADASRTEKTICLAVSPSLKAHGIPGRARLFEVVQKVKEANALRKYKAPRCVFTGASSDDKELKASTELAIDYIIAKPRMALYIEYSTRIYNTYLKYIEPEDIHVYSIDEVFIDATNYLDAYKLTPRELAMKMILDVLEVTGITATAGIGTNLYLCKIAMDIQAKHIPADKNGVRIAELNEMSYRRLLWSHKPITDFWRVGRGYAARLEKCGLHTMGDIARCSVGNASDYYNEDLLYKLFGVNAELLIDHAWGYEPCTLADIKAYKPSTNSIGSGQVLQSPYSFDRAKIIVAEMTELLTLDLVDKELVTDQIVLTIGYDIVNMTDPHIREAYKDAVIEDGYGRKVPKAAHGSVNLKPTSSTKLIVEAAAELFERIADRNLYVRRINVTANHVVSEKKAKSCEQLDLFTDCETEQAQKAEAEREKRAQKAMLEIKKKYGKNAILKGTNLQQGAMTIERNKQIGGHKA